MSNKLIRKSDYVYFNKDKMIQDIVNARCQIRFINKHIIQINDKYVYLCPSYSVICKVISKKEFIDILSKYIDNSNIGVNIEEYTLSSIGDEGCVINKATFREGYVVSFLIKISNKIYICSYTVSNYNDIIFIHLAYNIKTNSFDSDITGEVNISEVEYSFICKYARNNY